MGAWIEIDMNPDNDQIIQSLLSWERGLKFIFSCCAQSDVLSLLSWERGLKFYYFIVVSDIKASLLSWERGLKSGGHRLKNILHNVAPLVGAWIEMFLIARSMRLTPSLLSWERGLKSRPSYAPFPSGYRRSSRGSVD